VRNCVTKYSYFGFTTLKLRQLITTEPEVSQQIFLCGRLALMQLVTAVAQTKTVSANCLPTHQHMSHLVF
jgi:hypothetical protein